MDDRNKYRCYRDQSYFLDYHGERQMTIAEMIYEALEKQGRSQTWLAEQVGIKRITWAKKMKNDTFTAVELVRIGIVLDLDLNTFKKADLTPEQ